jgi:hypothetical protein
MIIVDDQALLELSAMQRHAVERIERRIAGEQAGEDFPASRDAEKWQAIDGRDG